MSALASIVEASNHELMMFVKIWFDVVFIAVLTT